MRWERYLRLVEETQHGTAVAGGIYADPQSTSLDSPDDQALVWASASGVDRQVAAGPYVMEGDVVLPLDDIISGFLFKWLLGAYSTAGTAVGGGGNTTLSAAAAAGDTIIAVTDATNFAVGDKVQVGTGNTAEVHEIQAIAAPNITLTTTLRFAHAAGEAAKEVTSPYTHQFFRGTSPLLTPFTLGIGKDVFEHIFAGCVANQLEIEVGDEIIAATLGVQASKDSKGSLATDVTFGEGNLYAPHDVTASIAGTDRSTRVNGLTLTINHNADLESGRGIGSRFPRRGYRGQLTVEGELSLAFIDTEELERYWSAIGATEPGTTLATFALDINFGSGLDISLPRVIYTAAGQPLSGQGRIEQTVAFRALYDAGSSSGPILITLTNNRAEY